MRLKLLALGLVPLDVSADVWLRFSFNSRSSECDVVRGECTQTYVPYLFLVIPLGPVTLTGQDYVLVESGCVCKPKYATESGLEAKVTP